ncbi:MAG: 6-carboxytetrahydropterin synthase [Planctomycetota bacterium]|nr:6-carboxytetrahydropterin synthase [Planctomycetota bacterium]
MPRPTVEITHAQEFSAAHRLVSAHLSEQANRELYGPCFTDHGHNYVVEVTVRGTVDPKTGMVMDLNRLSKLVVERLIARVDHRHLNHDVPFLAGTITTAENVAVAFWDELEPALRNLPGCKLYRIRLHESRANKVEYYGPATAASRSSSPSSSRSSARTRGAKA